MFLPNIGKPGDTSNFTEYPDSDTQSPEVAKKEFMWVFCAYVYLLVQVLVLAKIMVLM